ncbi:MAG: hypothetical protein ACOC16_02255 [Nanoarchaeota archaeon]
MAQTSKAMHHLHKKKPGLFNNTIEKLAYIAGIASPIVTLPQLIQIWIFKDASGISLITWISYLLIVVIMTLYGIIHKEKPLIIMYGSLIMIDLLIIIGAIIY